MAAAAMPPSGNNNNNRVALVLAGSFYPLHTGHIDLLRAARRCAVETLGATVTDAILLPTASSSLCRKFPELAASGSDDVNAVRTTVARRVLRSEPWITWHEGLLHPGPSTNHGIGAEVRNIDEALRRSHGAGAAPRIVQVCGTDSKLRAVLRGKRWGDVIVVVDARGIPPENAELLQGVCCVSAAHNAPKMSSTVERFWATATAASTASTAAACPFPACVVSPFDPTWLTDTGTTLGAGRQGVVRLMLLGATPVAVKLVRRGGKFDTFDIEAPLWQQLHDAGAGVTPPLVAVGTTDDGALGYIVTGVGASVTRLLGIAYEYSWRPADVDVAGDVGEGGNGSDGGDDDPVVRFLRSQPRVDLSAASVLREGGAASSTAAPAVGSVSTSLVVAAAAHNGNTAALDAAAARLSRGDTSDNDTKKDGTSTGNTLRLRCAIAEGIQRFTQALQHHGVLHRDIKVDNTLLFPDGTVRVCDFGVAKHAADSRRIARGNLRQYPPRAVRRAHEYDHACDAYMAATCIYEVLAGVPIYADCGASVEPALQLKLAGVLPEWPAGLRGAVDAAGRDAALRLRVQRLVAWVADVWAAETPPPPPAVAATAAAAQAK